MKILVVAGHPADMFDHCGGTLLKHLKNGDEVTCVSMTQGLRVHDEVISDVFRERIDQFTTKEIEKIIQERQKVKAPGGHGGLQIIWYYRYPFFKLRRRDPHRNTGHDF